MEPQGQYKGSCRPKTKKKREEKPKMKGHINSLFSYLYVAEVFVIFSTLLASLVSLALWV